MTSMQAKHIWIIGASSGIGAALARELSAAGAQLVLSARRHDELTRLNRELGDRHHVVPCDVGDAQSVARAIAMIDHVMPHLDSVMFMAAMYNPMKLDELDLDITEKLLNANVMGAFRVVHAVLPRMKAQKSGQIVLCGSVAAYRGLPKGQPYCASKAAVMSLAESLRIEMEPYNIDVRLISPGFVRTPLTDKNNFAMPSMIEPGDAARRIIRGLQGSAFDIHFPKRFTMKMKLLRLMPNWLFLKIARTIKL